MPNFGNVVNGSILTNAPQILIYAFKNGIRGKTFLHKKLYFLSDVVEKIVKQVDWPKLVENSS